MQSNIPIIHSGSFAVHTKIQQTFLESSASPLAELRNNRSPLRCCCLFSVAAYGFDTNFIKRFPPLRGMMVFVRFFCSDRRFGTLIPTYSMEFSFPTHLFAKPEDDLAVFLV
ncbi:Protein of unknown function [Pyronema omphalodes CBS 100304]|uniref:Uncharacterized protein n=1 Tax=Pyronema omphalodes (strain CBS 100304) TaxID=1076935 RepID=U4LVQ6_PYROM|nr:Protein of unknown function [Pyronema omphalodes CBS 100304]